MFDFATLYTLTIFSLMVLFLFWRPHGINESIPPTISALLIFFAGIVPLSDISIILGFVSGASITILSTIVMSIVLDSIGFFRWAAYNLVNRAKGSGVLLYWYINLLCFLMTLFFNNDGSILITTPIIIEIVLLLKLKSHQQFPYLISGALIATASSAPIAVSNLANLIALKIIGLDLNSYVSMMFVPSMLGITAISLLLFYYFRKDIPKRINVLPVVERPHMAHLHHGSHSHPNAHPLPHQPKPPHLTLPHLLTENAMSPPVPDMSMFKVCIAIVALTRAGLFVGASFGIPIEWTGVFGALVLIGYRWYRKGVGAKDIVDKTPWHIMLFAFSIYVVVYSLHNIGLTEWIVKLLREPMLASHLNACLISGGLLTLMSNLLNNLPSVMIGTLTLIGMGLDMPTLHIAYLASIMGADIGSLITPMGTLATLIWMFLLKKNGIKIGWANCLKVTLVVIPIGLLVSLFSLYFWLEWLFF
ncbi:MAG TPA: arsenic transporter [Desulfosporosinus sp.]|jgi:arsenical pump membrane protein|nr:arsenic transporter [Desulfosporosinus sp.]